MAHAARSAAMRRKTSPAQTVLQPEARHQALQRFTAFQQAMDDVQHVLQMGVGFVGFHVHPFGAARHFVGGAALFGGGQLDMRHALGNVFGMLAHGSHPLGGVFGIYELLPAFLVSLAVCAVVSLVTPAPTEDILAEFDAAK